VKFSVHATVAGSQARAATLSTAREAIATPVFMPVGTRGTVRTQTLPQLEQLAAHGAQILLANTYHLLVRPGLEVFERFGGLGRWMGWPHAILTDSGGFQIFSLPGTTIDEAGAVLREPGGREVVLSPERSIAAQRAIGADIMMVLDHCIASTSPRAHAEEAMHRTHRWAARCLAARGDAAGALFAIVQGACVPELRRISADVVTGLPGFDGYAIGGLAVGEARAQREDMTELVTRLLPPDRPRYLMGVGMPIDLLEGVHRGIDLFDCILPTALAQQGVAFTSRGRIDLARGVHRLAEQALDPACACDACTRTPRSYLHHLVKCQEPLGWQLLAFHNLAFYVRLMADIRAHIRAGTFLAFRAEQRELLGRADPDHPPGRRPRVKPKQPQARGAFALHTSPHGFASIQHVPSGEIMHSVNDPDAEAARIYVGQSILIARALAPPSAALAASPPAPAPLVVWDVGLGAGHNAMALVRAFEQASAPTPELTLVSFERDLDALRLALAHVGHFPHLRHRAPHVLAHRGSYRHDRFTWLLCGGDFLSAFATQPQPDVIFYDPFFAKVDQEMWSLAAFTRLFDHLTRPVELFTYTSSTAIRSAMLVAGFHVARGVASGPKPETTIALKHLAAPHALLGRDWLARRERSTARFPADVPLEQHPALELALHHHAQFAAER
jgi:queuine tRNA-ribosyltransferase